MLNEVSIQEAGELVTSVGICLYPGSCPACRLQPSDKLQLIPDLQESTPIKRDTEPFIWRRALQGRTLVFSPDTANKHYLHKRCEICVHFVYCNPFSALVFYNKAMPLFRIKMIQQNAS